MCSNTERRSWVSSSAGKHTVPQDVVSTTAYSTLEEAVKAKDADIPSIVGKNLPIPAHILDCVVKIYSTYCEPNYALPWSMTSQSQSVSTGFIISEKRILTNAHSIEHHTIVMVKRRRSDRKYRAKVIAVGIDCDLALLQVTDERFWNEHEADTAHILPSQSSSKAQRFSKSENHPVVSLSSKFESGGRESFGESDNCYNYPYLIPGGFTSLNDSCMVVGYPFPGENISITAGVCSRVEMERYVHNNGDLLAVQIDAAINSGNSGGPVLNDKFQVLGVAFQSVDAGEAESVGYFIPNMVVNHFLEDIARNQKYTGFPAPGFQWQQTENVHMRRALKVPDDVGGILIRSVDQTSDSMNVLKKGDIVTHIDNVALSSAGTIPFQSGERICFTYLITTKFVGETVTVVVLRDAEKLNVEYKLPEMGSNRLVPRHDPWAVRRKQPEYIVIGGLVFQTLSEPFLRAVFGDNWLFDTPVRLIDHYYNGKKTADGITEMVVLSQILRADVNEGYEDDLTITILHRFNSARVQNLRHLAEMIDKLPDEEEFYRFDLDYDEVIILDKQAAHEEAESILETHCIPADKSTYIEG